MTSVVIIASSRRMRIIMKTLNDITIYDLMAEDLDVWVQRDQKFGVNIQIDDENGNTILEERQVHKCAAGSFADFCRSYLISYERAIQ